MASGKMHADEIDIDETLVRSLIMEQFPQWAALPIQRVPSAGTDNAMYRLGEVMAVRLPRIPRTATQTEKEQQWLPRLAPFLPFAIPIPLAYGEPGAGYPLKWSVYQWLEGETATPDQITDPTQLAGDVAAFISALQQIDATEGPLPGDHNFGRGVPLASRDAQTRAAISQLHGMVDVDAVIKCWEDALRTPTWNRPPVWLHGDLKLDNLLFQHGHLSAVIDFGGLGIGDPACDLQIAWNLFKDEARAAFKETLQVDDATWARGRGWALSVALIALPYYQHTNPTLAGLSRRTIAAVLADRNLRV